MTPFEDIYDLFLMQIQDYKLDKLYNTSDDEFKLYLQGFLLLSLMDFDNCSKDLNEYDLDLQQFDVDLSMTEKTILSKLMVIQWLTKEIQNITALNNFLNNTDFKMYSNANLLKEKSAYKDKLREEIHQDLTRYGLKNIPWDNWNLGVFS
jgi:hypothetical protein